MEINVNWRSASFWTALAGAAGLVCGAVGVGNLATPVETAITAIGGLLIALAGHGVITAQAAREARAAGK